MYKLEQIRKLKKLIQNGYGLTGKPIPERRMKKLKETLAKLERDENQSPQLK